MVLKILRSQNPCGPPVRVRAAVWRHAPNKTIYYLASDVAQAAAPQNDTAGNGMANRTLEPGAEIAFGAMTLFEDGRNTDTNIAEALPTKRRGDESPPEGILPPKKARFDDTGLEPTLTAAGRPARSRAGQGAIMTPQFAATSSQRGKAAKKAEDKSKAPSKPKASIRGKAAKLAVAPTETGADNEGAQTVMPRRSTRTR